MDEYWDRRCLGCTETGHTNRECVTETAADLGISVEQAMREFGPRTQEPTCATNWQLQNKAAGT